MLELVSSTVFAVSLFLLFVTYAGYPLLYRLLGNSDVSEPPASSSDLSIAIVIVARNEAARIGAKLRNLLAQTPATLISQIIVVSDQSTDGTQDVVRELSATDDRIVLLELEDATGKAAGLRAGVAIANADIIVFSDVRQDFIDGALDALCHHFSDDNVGAVCGELRFSEANAVVGAYWRYETALRRAEANFDSVIGCTGAIYAIRRDLFVPPPVGLILDDVWIPMHVVFQGYRVRYESDAAAIEPASTSSGNEFRKKVRTLAGNYQLVQNSSKFVSPRANRLWWAFILHKLARLAGPLLLVLAFCSALFLPWPANLVFAGAQSIAYLLAGLVQVFPAIGGVCRLCRLCHSFVILNLAAGVAFTKAITGKYDDLWGAEPAKPTSIAGQSGTT